MSIELRELTEKVRIRVAGNVLAGDVYVNDWIGEIEYKLNKNLNKKKLRLSNNKLKLPIQAFPHLVVVASLAW
jgi:hypothetical protein